ncbi:MAG TPA: Rrf2 family transcriptional regulator [Lentimicrobium sp.]|nr:Rrf2 family transcriptional regulator [Lentimicrobium sp.]
MSRIFPFTEATSIAFKSMVILSSSQRPLSIRNISLMINANPHHVGKILQRLARRNLVYSKPGSKGGFLLNKSIHRITLFEIYESVEGSGRLDYLKDLKEKDGVFRPIDFLSVEISNHFISFLKSHNLSMYVANKLQATTQAQ